jgi:hypothetical protein
LIHIYPGLSPHDLRTRQIINASQINLPPMAGTASCALRFAPNPP